MALFKRKKVEEKVEQERAATHALPSGVAVVGSEHALLLRNPRITEKATEHQTSGIYTFDVANNATKRSIGKAIVALYNVRPKKIRMVHVPEKIKRNIRTGARGVSRGGKKAYVYLKKGDTIALA